MCKKLSKKSVKLLKNLIRDAFDKIDFDMEFLYNESEPLIQLATESGFKELVKQMKEDVKLEQQMFK
jgi:hypothetical protein